jgi:hypothetical protein
MGSLLASSQKGGVVIFHSCSISQGLRTGRRVKARRYELSDALYAGWNDFTDLLEEKRVSDYGKVRCEPDSFTIGRK